VSDNCVKWLKDVLIRKVTPTGGGLLRPKKLDLKKGGKGEIGALL